MATILPVPTTRVPNSLARDRLVRQLEGDQVSLARLQTQISTGRRVLLPSDDAPAALRGIALQQLLERKQQVQTNLSTSQSYLSASDAAISNISNLLASIRGSALGVIDSGATDTQRAAAAEEVDRAIQQLLEAGNQKFRGRHLFSGSLTTTEPFQNSNGNILYSGNETALQSYADTDLLFDTNVNGNAVFGSLSAEVRGSADLNPLLSPDTLLSDLRGGQGIAKGSIAISDGTSTSIVELSGASSLDDVLRLLETNPPPGRSITASITNNALKLQLDAGGGGDLRVIEVGGGTTATDLGILRETGSGTGPVTGTDLNPRLTKTTRLTSLLGTRATATATTAGTENDLVFTAQNNGAQQNNVTIEFVDNPAVTAGNETVAYDTSSPGNPKIIFQIDEGATTANDILATFNDNATLTALFSANLLRSDTVGAENNGTGLISATSTATTSGGSGVTFDANSGMRITSGDQTFNISFATATTVEDLLNKINGAGAGLSAEINQSGTGINVRSRLSGVDFSIGENGGTTATGLGLRTFTGGVELSQLNHGLGVHQFEGADFSIRRKDGVAFDIDVAGASTVQDVIDRINNHADNQDPAHRVTAQLAAFGNGIELVTNDASTTATLAVIKSPLSQAAVDLGLIAAGSTIREGSVSGSSEVLTGRDVNPTEVAGAFTSLLRLSAALRSGDTLQATRAIGLLDDASQQLNNTRAEVGARQQGLDAIANRLDSEVVTLKGSLSNEVDVDLAKSISELTARQAAYQATLQTTASISRLSLLDFL
jgi:flagellin-like hook-associated protein FlgL